MSGTSYGEMIECIDAKLWKVQKYIDVTISVKVERHLRISVIMSNCLYGNC